jgi:RNA polymerase sigma factor (sigma-70 family)
MNDLLEPPDEPSTALAPGTVPYRPVTLAPGEVATFSAFYRAEVRALVNFMLWMGAGVTDASDLAQETMIDAYRGWASIQHPRAWIRRVASRKFARRRFEESSAGPCSDRNPLLNATETITAWEQRQEVLRLLATLPWRQRQVMAWSYDGYEPREIADELDISAATVRASLKLARRALATRLDPGGDTTHD